LGAALAGGTGTNALAALAVILTGLQYIFFLAELMYFSEARSKAGEQVTGFEVPEVQPDNLWEGCSIAMSADKWGDSRHRGESCGEVHVVCYCSIELLSYELINS
jgi:hypothetical protein